MFSDSKFMSEGNVVLEECYMNIEALIGKENTEHTEIVDGHTVGYHGKTLSEAYGRRCGLYK